MCYCFAALACAAEYRVGELKSQDLASTARPFATADQSDELLLALLTSNLHLVFEINGVTESQFANTATSIAL